MRYIISCTSSSMDLSDLSTSRFGRCTVEQYILYAGTCFDISYWSLLFLYSDDVRRHLHTVGINNVVFLFFGIQ